MDEIEARLEAVEDLLSSKELCHTFDLLMRVPDLERKLSRIRAWAQGREEVQGVAEGSASLRRAAQELVAALDGFRELDRFREAIVGQLHHASSLALRKKISELPHIGSMLQSLLDSFDINIARASKTIVLHPGCCADFDRARQRKVIDIS